MSKEERQTEIDRLFPLLMCLPAVILNSRLDYEPTVPRRTGGGISRCSAHSPDVYLCCVIISALENHREEGVSVAGGGGVPAGWGNCLPDGIPHHESPGGCCVGVVEYRSLHLRLHPHHRDGGAYTHSGECHHGAPVCYRPADGFTGRSIYLHTTEEALME